MTFLLFVVVLPVLGTWAGAAILATAFRRSGRHRLLWVAGALVPLLAVGALIFVIADRNDYSAIVAVWVLIVASVAALVGAGVLVLKPPAARRVAAVLLVTVYPLILLGLIFAANWIATGLPPIKFVGPTPTT